MSDPTQNHEAYHTAQGDEITEHVRLPESGLRELVVRNAQGVIRIRGTERDDVLVHAVKGGRTDSRRYREASLLLEEHEGRIFVRPHIPGGPGWIGLGLPTGFIKRGPGRFDFDVDFDKLNFAFGGDVWFDIDIELPHRTANANPAISVRNASGEVSVSGIHQGQLNVATSSGEVAVSDCHGSMHIATASGDMVMRGVGGDVVVTTASGDVHVGGVTGRLTARSASGDLDVDGGTLADLHFSTASGDHNVTAAFTSPGPYRFETVSGDVNLALSLPLTGSATEPAARLEFSTVSGDAAIQPPFRHAGKKTWETGASPQSGALIRVKTVSGDLHLRAVGDANVTAAAAPTAPINQEDEMPTGPIPPMPPMPPTPPGTPYPSFSDAFAAAGEQIARQAEVVSQRAMQQAVEALERAAAKMRPLGSIPDNPPPTGRPAPPPPREASAPAAAAAEPAAPAPALSPEAEQQRLEVLQALERGEIEIDEAMSRLDALESGAPAAPATTTDTAPDSAETPPTP